MTQAVMKEATVSPIKFAVRVTGGPPPLSSPVIDNDPLTTRLIPVGQ